MYKRQVWGITAGHTFDKISLLNLVRRGFIVSILLPKETDVFGQLVSEIFLCLKDIYKLCSLISWRQIEYGMESNFAHP